MLMFVFVRRPIVPQSGAGSRSRTDKGEMFWRVLRRRSPQNVSHAKQLSPQFFSAFVLVLSLRSAGAQGAEALQTNRFSIIAGPVLQSPSESLMRITWITDCNATGTIEYGASRWAVEHRLCQ